MDIVEHNDHFAYIVYSQKFSPGENFCRFRHLPSLAKILSTIFSPTLKIAEQIWQPLLHIGEYFIPQKYYVTIQR